MQYKLLNSKTAAGLYKHSEKESDSIEKIEKQSNPKVMNLL